MPTEVSMLDHVNFTVKDLDASFEFYHKVFGFEPMERDDSNSPRWGIMKSNDAIICMTERPNCEFIDRHEAVKRGLQYMAHVGMRIHDRESWEATIIDQDIKVNYGGEIKMPHGSSWYI
ncbi:MAG TPA: hypothetical protein EYQ73_01690, partial [Candidatus Poseidoniales archaeon]|nr:hypothetical protein [Candidatus Poseidoniales archaeon]